MKFKNALMLIITAFIWGVAFVSQTVGMDHVEPFTFNSIRFILGGLVLIPVILLRARKPETALPKGKKNWGMLLLGGVCCGVCLAAASAFQQFGLYLGTPAGKSGFITALYIVIVPILGLFFKKRAGIVLWISVAIAVVGLYFLCMTGEGGVTLGDLLTLVCSLLFAVHILIIDYFVLRTDGVQLACLQFFVAGIVHGILMLATETPSIDGILSAWVPLLYSGLLACGVAYTFQIIGQKGMNPTIASLLMSLESVFAVLAGWALLGQTLSAKEWIGITLMAVAIVLAQLPSKKEKKNA